MAFQLHRVTSADDLEAICAQMQPSNWAADNEMTQYTPDLLRKFLEAGNDLLLAYAEENIAGAAIVHELLHPSGEHSLYVHELDTHPDYRRQGVASLIMREVMKLAKQRAMTEVWVGTEADNIAANALYKSLNPSEIEQSVIYAYKVK